MIQFLQFVSLIFNLRKKEEKKVIEKQKPNKSKKKIFFVINNIPWFGTLTISPSPIVLDRPKPQDIDNTLPE